MENNENRLTPKQIAFFQNNHKDYRKVTFLQKIHEGLKWAGESQERQAYIGIGWIKNTAEEEKIVINPATFGALCGIELRSVLKNLRLNGFHRIERYKGSWYVFSTQNPNPIQTLPISPYSPEEKSWQEFNDSFPDNFLSDFVASISPQTKSVFPPLTIFQLLIPSEKLTFESYCFLHSHFGPKSSIYYKVMQLTSSIFSRGWKYSNEQIPNSVCLAEGRQIIFFDGSISVCVENDLKKGYDELWLVDQNGNYVEIEELFLFNFPSHEPSIHHYSDSAMDYLT